ncbi:MAG TPA: LPS assembly protein LptD [Gammaproteobacteria bacterium]|nr:LPS assembly protein LptD [Gammaproteobacteria bacterium]
MFLTIISVLILSLVSGSVVAANRRSVEEYWWLCPVDRSMPIRPEFSSDALAPGSTEVRAESTHVAEQGVTEFSGEVELVQEGRALSADDVTYDQPNETMTAVGQTKIWDESLLWSGYRAMFNLRDNRHRLERGNYWLIDRQGRGYAELIRTDNLTHVSRLERVDYTTCPAGAETWKFSASKIKLDHAEERGYATNALLKVRGVPVFWVPYINFPLSDKRKSGFLTPTLGTSNERGIDAEVPYYIDIAPNMDATVAPRWISERGTMLKGEYRYMGRRFESELDVEYLPSDKLTDEDRSYVRLEHEQRFGQEDRGYMYALLQNASDAQYFEDFGGGLAITSQRFLDRRIQTTYFADRYQFWGTMQAYQNIDDSIPDRFGPYRRLPNVLAQTVFPQYHLKPHFYGLADVTYFDRADSVTGARVYLQPTLTLPFIKPWTYIRPSIGLRQTNYLLTEAQDFDSTIAHAVPFFSTDVQFFLERRLRLWDTPLLQTLEPRAYYVLIPKVDQSDTPIFDTGLYDLTFLQLFNPNRFSGRDRVGDTNQLALAMTSRFLSLESGRELFRTSLGQIYYFRDREIALPSGSINDDSSSEFIGEIAASPVESWSARATVQWDPHENQTEKSALSLRYAPPDGTVINAAYRLRRAITDVEQTDLSWRIPLTENLSMVGRWNYSLQSKQSLELVGGLELETCCWGIRLLSRRFIRNVEGEFDNAIFVQAEFKGLGGFGRSAASFLRKSIPGYEPIF